MAILAEYYKPKTLAEALDLLADRASRRVPLAGGVHLVPVLETRQRRDVDGVVDLAGLELNFVEREGAELRVGAMTTLTDFVEHPLCASLASGILQRTARYEGPLNLRNASTVGGLVALAQPDSELFAALLALQSSVVAVDGNGVASIHLIADFALRKPQCTRPVELITEVRVPLATAPPGPVSGHARIARTPMGRCIVAAVVVATEESSILRAQDTTKRAQDTASADRSLHVAFCGLGDRPLLAGTAPNPPSDFKGSAQYRLAMADVVRRRALTEALNALL